MTSTAKAVADTGPRMGRPSLGVRPLTVRLPTAEVERIKEVAGENRVAAFIREAVAEKLAREGGNGA